MFAAGARPSSATSTRSSAMTVTLRSRSVSAASGVTMPPFCKATVSPASSIRASASVMISNLFMLCSHPVTTLFTAEQIHARIEELASEIDGQYAPGNPLHLVAVLKGAFIFLSDLARALAPRPVTLDFIAVSSYGAATKSSGEVRLLKDLDAPLQGRDVIIVEDIVDTGLTLAYLQDVLRARDPKTLRTACLLSKPSRRKVDVRVEYIGFEIEDKFVVGYG